MKILFVISSLSSGGAERVLCLLANRWCARHDVAVATIKGRDADFFSLDSRIRRLAFGVRRSRWWSPLPHLSILGKLRRLIRNEKPDFVISFVIKTNIFTLGACLGLGARVIACEHSVIERDDIDPRQHLLRRLFYRRAYRIGVLLGSVREEFLRVYPRVDPGKVVVIPNPISLERTGIPDFRPFEEQFGCRRGDVDIVLAMGRLIPLKGFDTLISAFAAARRQHARLRLVIAGEGPELHRLRSIAEAAGVEREILFLGSTRSPDAALGQADVFAMTSRFEGFPMALVEAYIAGLPVVAFNAPGVRDIVENEVSGLLVDYGKTEDFARALLRALADRDLRDRLRAGALRVVQRYTPDAIDEVWFKQVLI
jgi:GalNAc-alpha-(1->4)-GalNAc-alpha-(1->3)-diNAcBac-PP-undecaprenol alpha-1,4-N-acetyl-D-galactosaminyltransferase